MYYFYYTTYYYCWRAQGSSHHSLISGEVITPLSSTLVYSNSAHSNSAHYAVPQHHLLYYATLFCSTKPQCIVVTTIHDEANYLIPLLSVILIHSQLPSGMSSQAPCSKSLLAEPLPNLLAFCYAHTFSFCLSSEVEMKKGHSLT